MRRRTLDALQELLRELLDLVQRERLILVVLEEVEDGGGEKFGREANVVLVVERVEKMDALTVSWASPSQRERRWTAVVEGGTY